ncbi:MAG: TatD family hydrolase [Vampirovibrionales bacterium]|nr:TatD family hydrolase [Vampirovibrionales bacterium]
MTLLFDASLPTLIDTHSHVDYITRREGPKPYPEEASFTEASSVLARARAVGVQAVINPGTSPENFDKVLNLACTHEGLFAALAIHPCDIAEQPTDPSHLPAIMARIQGYLKDPTTGPRIVAIGETGLDYYHDTSAAAAQRDWFMAFMDLAQTNNLPVIIHDREAHNDVANCVAASPGITGVMHCFSGDAAFADTMMAHGFYISFAGNLTFKNATQLHEAAKSVPLDRMLVETDAPFLAPIPFRGQASEPAFVHPVAQKIADLKGISLEAVAEATTQNALRLFSKLHLPNGAFPPC